MDWPKCENDWVHPEQSTGRRTRLPFYSNRALATLPEPLLSYIGRALGRIIRFVTAWSLANVPERNAMKRRGKVWAAVLPALFLWLATPGAPLLAQTTRPPSFLAEKYDVSAYVDTIA